MYYGAGPEAVEKFSCLATSPKHSAEEDIPILCILAGVRCEWCKILIWIGLSLEEITEVLNVSQNSDQSSSVIGTSRESHFFCAVLSLGLVSATKAE